jgi:hypothetical protein
MPRGPKNGTCFFGPRTRKCEILGFCSPHCQTSEQRLNFDEDTARLSGEPLRASAATCLLTGFNGALIIKLIMRLSTACNYMYRL